MRIYISVNSQGAQCSTHTLANDRLCFMIKEDEDIVARLPPMKLTCKLQSTDVEL